jgi:RNA polymerase sigma-70 factor (sigma-E family)
VRVEGERIEVVQNVQVEREFEAFVSTTSLGLFRLAALLCAGDHHAAEDLLQDAYLEGFSRWDQLRVPEARTAYVRQVMVRRAYRVRTRFRRERQLLEQIGETDHGEQPWVVTDHSTDIWRALGTLSPRQRAVIVLRYYADLSEEQTAHALNCTTGTVKTHAARGRRAIEDHLGGRAYITPSDEGGAR